MMHNLHDTHFHLDLHETRAGIIKEIESNEVFTIAVTNLPPLFEKLEKEVRSKFIKVSLGFHPELISQYKKYIPAMWKLLPKTRLIGEVGIDLSAGKESRSEQVSFFEELINRCNDYGDKVLSIHSRSAYNEVISIIGSNFNGTKILHWFSGPQKNLERAINNGYYFSINYSMTCSEAGRKIISRIPRDRILLESDSPFIEIDRRVFRLSDLEKIIINIAKIKGFEVDDIKRALEQNFITCYPNIF